MHLLIYRHRPDVNAVCHAHPPVATGYAAAGIPLNKALLCELVLSLGCVPVAPYGTPGTPELADSIEPFVDGYDAILLANHGVVTYGHDLLTAFFRMETTEHFARVALVTEMLGKQVLLSSGDVEKLVAARARYGLQTALQLRSGISRNFRNRRRKRAHHAHPPRIGSAGGRSHKERPRPALRNAWLPQVSRRSLQVLPRRHNCLREFDFVGAGLRPAPAVRLGTTVNLAKFNRIISKASRPP